MSVDSGAEFRGCLYQVGGVGLKQITHVTDAGEVDDVRIEVETEPFVDGRRVDPDLRVRRGEQLV